MSVTLDLGEWCLVLRGNISRSTVEVLAIERPTFHEDALTPESIKAERLRIPVSLWECLVDVVSSHDKARAKLKECWESHPDLATSIVIPALEMFSRRARVRKL